MHSVLEIKSLVLPVHLGQDKAEREKPQKVAFHITVGFPDPPKEEQTDKMEDSVCYFRLCEIIRKSVNKPKGFCLIEGLGGLVWKNLRKCLPQKALLKVSVHKIQAPVPFLKEGVSYTCGDLSLP